MQRKLDEFTRAYVECSLWASTDNSDDSGGEPLDANYSIADIDSESLEKMVADCLKFQEENSADIESGPDGENYSCHARAGHDFWLTRNHHGSGFWDGDWPDSGDRLTSASDTFGECDIYVGDSGKLYI